MFGEWIEGIVALTVGSLVGAAAGAAVIYVTISRVGWHKTRAVTAASQNPGGCRHLKVPTRYRRMPNGADCCR